MHFYILYLPKNKYLCPLIHVVGIDIMKEPEKTLAEYKLDALRSQMNPHFIFNAITAIQHFIMNNEKRAAIEYLDEFSTLIRKFLDHSRADNISLSEEMSLLISYINLESARFANKFGFVVNMADDIDPDAIKIPPMLIQPFAENAIKHALMHKADYGLLRIDFHIEEKNILKVTIEDDGIGRKKSSEINQWRTQSHKPLAIEVTKERLEIWNQKHGCFQESLVILDLYDENGMALGTRVTSYIYFTR